MPLTKAQHLDPSLSPKRILALDGGGIRGILTLQFLQAVEDLIKARFGETTRLCDYFDLIGGTSTGSIIAAGLACGMSVAQLKQIYRDVGAKVFQTSLATRIRLGGVLTPKFPSDPLQTALDAELGAETTLDSDKILTGLMVMTKRLDTGSTWPLTNCDRGRYEFQNGKLRLTQLVRASTAAPTYFAPEEIRISRRDGTSVEGAFVDGGVTPFNDPALQLLMLAAFPGHGFCWPTGKDRLLLISIGTGRYQRTHTANELMNAPAVKQAVLALQSLMDDCERMNRATLQWLTSCLTPWIIDRAVGDMKLDSESGPQLATYVRYNAVLEQAWLKTELGLDLDQARIDRIRKMDDPSNLDGLADLGREAAAKMVKPEHLPATFDLAKASV